MTIDTSEPDKNSDKHKDESPNGKEITEKVINLSIIFIIYYSLSIGQLINCTI